VCIKITALMANVALIAPLLWSAGGRGGIHVLPEGMFGLVCRIGSDLSVCNEPCSETATRIGEKLSPKRTRS
nr:hypothetical protein [Escherichia coli]